MSPILTISIEVKVKSFEEEYGVSFFRTKKTVLEGEKQSREYIDSLLPWVTWVRN